MNSWELKNDRLFFFDRDFEVVSKCLEIDNRFRLGKKRESSH